MGTHFVQVTCKKCTFSLQETCILRLARYNLAGKNLAVHCLQVLALFDVQDACILCTKCARKLTYPLHFQEFLHVFCTYSASLARKMLHGTCTIIARILHILQVGFSWVPCPDAFILSGDTCVCEERLQAYNATCTIGDEITITRNAGLRLRYTVCSLIIHEILFYYFCEAQLFLLSHIKYNENIL